MRFTRTAALGIAAAAIAGSVVFAAGHANVDGAITARKSVMQLYAFNLGILGNMAKGSVEFDAAGAQRAADNMVALSSMDTTDLWPAGSSADDVDGTRALAVIWDDIPAVMEKVGALSAAATAMSENAGTLEGVQANMGALGQACGACHQAYRAPG